MQQAWQASLAWLARPEAERAVAILAACLLANGSADRPAWRRACAAAAVALAGRLPAVGLEGE